MDSRDKVRAIIDQISILTQAEKDIIVEETIIEAFKKGTILLRQGQVPNQCFMVVEGCVREYTIRNGVEKTTGFFTEGDKITPHAYDDNGQPSDHFLECLEDCIITISNRAYERRLLELLPRLAEVMPAFALEELKKAKSEWTQFVTSSPEERYNHLMETRPSLFNRVAHHQIASYLGMQPQSLSRIRKRIFNKQTQASNGSQVVSDHS
ncbi:MAG: cyclic nucleotide-binding domain-containing protein [Bacteroidota bacterium]